MKTEFENVLKKVLKWEKDLSEFIWCFSAQKYAMAEIY
jgi:hypothetical protein